MGIEARWQSDIGALTTLNADWRDELQVVNPKDQLICSPGAYLRKKGLGLTPHSAILLKHIEYTVNVIAVDLFNSIKESAQKTTDPKSYFERVVNFSRQVGILAMRISDICYTYESDDCNQASIKERYSKLYETASSFKKEVIVYKKTLNPPESSPGPEEHFSYTERTDSREIKYSRLKNVPFQEIVTAAKNALSLTTQPRHARIDSLKKESLRIIKDSFFNLVPLIGALMLSVLKIILWNPFEFLFKGVINTKSPLRLLIEEESLLPCSKMHMFNYQLLVRTITQRPYVKQEQALAFKELVLHVESLDWSTALLASEDMIGLADFLPAEEGAITPALFLASMQRHFNQNDSRSLYSVESLYKGINADYLEKKAQFKGPEDYLNNLCEKIGKRPKPFEASEIHPYVSPDALKIILEAAASSPTCREIKLSKYLFNLSYVQETLSRNGFSISADENNQYSRTYKKL